MSFIEYFFRTNIEQPPSKLILIPFNVVVLVAIFFYYYSDKKHINPKIVAICNLVQQIMLYCWYIFGIPEKAFYQGLPLYHCRISIIVISLYILFNKKSKVATFFSYIGLIGSIVTLLTLDLDNYGLVHFSHFSYMVGHYLLVFNALHIMREDNEVINFKFGIFSILSLNLFIQLVNLNIDNANYGELARMPNLFSFTINQPYYFIFATLIYILIFAVGRLIHKRFHLKHKLLTD